MMLLSDFPSAIPILKKFIGELLEGDINQDVQAFWVALQSPRNLDKITFQADSLSRAKTNVTIRWDEPRKRRLGAEIKSAIYVDRKSMLRWIFSALDDAARGRVLTISGGAFSLFYFEPFLKRLKRVVGLLTALIFDTGKFDRIKELFNYIKGGQGEETLNLFENLIVNQSGKNVRMRNISLDKIAPIYGNGQFWEFTLLLNPMLKYTV